VEETVDCIGSDATVIEQRTCNIALDTLIVEPYSLILNEGINAKIISQNYYGDSVFSESGNGGLVKLIPDAPVNL
jgi:hypothetical protein